MPFKIFLLGSVGIINILTTFLLICFGLWSALYVVPILNEIHVSLGAMYILVIVSVCLSKTESFLVGLLNNESDEDDSKKS